MSREMALVLSCEQQSLVAIHHCPERVIGSAGVVLLVGGPQYRVGSHRQFVLLARYLADQGIPVLRFDYRGMGDSEGALRDFVDVNKDVRVAVNTLLEHQPDIDEVVIWGLCDAASAAAFYAWTDDRISGLVLLNPWVRTNEGEAKAYLKHYYLQRLISKAFWGKVLRFQFDVVGSVRSIGSLLGRLRGTRCSSPASITAPLESARHLALPDRMLHGLRAFDGDVLLVLSGQDLVAREFEDLTQGSKSWQKWMSSSQLTLKRFEQSDHTFSRRDWRDQVSCWTAEWLKQ